jgi:hypothetical protein
MIAQNSADGTLYRLPVAQILEDVGNFANSSIC